jgi:hypothetical protein
MAYDYTYLGLVNEICNQVNEVELTSTNFDTAEPAFFKMVKNAVNRTIADITNSEDYWRFNFAQTSITLTPGEVEYDWPDDVNVIDFDSFIIPQDDVLGTQTRFLSKVNYDDWLQNHSRHQFYTDLGQRTMPRSVVKTPTDKFIVFPAPDLEYPLRFDAYLGPEILEDFDDVPRLPEKYRFALIMGIMRDVHSFREAEFNAQMAEAKFDKYLKDMRRREVNLFDYMRSSMIARKATVGQPAWLRNG